MADVASAIQDQQLPEIPSDPQGNIAIELNFEELLKSPAFLSDPKVISFLDSEKGKAVSANQTKAEKAGYERAKKDMEKSARAKEEASRKEADFAVLEAKYKDDPSQLLEVYRQRLEMERKNKEDAESRLARQDEVRKTIERVGSVFEELKIPKGLFDWNIDYYTIDDDKLNDGISQFQSFKESIDNIVAERVKDEINKKLQQDTPKIQQGINFPQGMDLKPWTDMPSAQN